MNEDKCRGNSDYFQERNYFYRILKQGGYHNGIDFIRCNMFILVDLILVTSSDLSHVIPLFFILFTPPFDEL